MRFLQRGRKKQKLFTNWWDDLVPSTLCVSTWNALHLQHFAIFEIIVMKRNVFYDFLRRAKTSQRLIICQFQLLIKLFRCSITKKKTVTKRFPMMTRGKKNLAKIVFFSCACNDLKQCGHPLENSSSPIRHVRVSLSTAVAKH